MNDLSQTLKRGVLLIIETGEYSDREWNGPVRVKKAFVKDAVAKEFVAGFKPSAEYEGQPEDQWSKKPSPDDFLPWIIKSGYVEDVDNVHAWHVGCYSDFEP